MHFVSERGDRRLPAIGFALIALAFVALLAFAARAQATESIYWDNYSADPDNVAFADISGAGGGVLNSTGAEIAGPEGMAYDSVTNRLYVAVDGGPTAGQIAFINLDGSGGGYLSAPGAVIEDPEGIALDPTTRILYWVNTKDSAPSTGSIGWAKLDGSAGGRLDTTGATLDDPYRGIAVDPAHGKVYWSNSGPNPEVISYANANNTGGGGNLDITGAPAPVEITGMAADPAGGRLYWLDNEAEKVGFASLGGGGGGELNLAGATFKDPYGFAFDPAIGRAYWGNYGNDEERNGAIGFVNVAGGGGSITPLTAPVDGPQDPVILKSPTPAGAPAITRNPKALAELVCSTGNWGADSASGVYQAPRSFVYQWTRNGAPIGGANAATFAAKSPGSYACTVTAVNQTGSTAQVSAGVSVKAAKVKLKTKRKASVKAGGIATFKIKAVNQGDLQSKNARVCVKLPKKAKADLKAKPKCKALGKVKGHGKDSAKLRIKVGATAAGTYKVKFQVKGSPGKAAKAKIVVR